MTGRSSFEPNLWSMVVGEHHLEENETHVAEHEVEQIFLYRNVVEDHPPPIKIPLPDDVPDLPEMEDTPPPDDSDYFSGSGSGDYYDYSGSGGDESSGDLLLGKPTPEPKYKIIESQAFDIALVKLKKPVKLDDYVNVVCLAAANETVAAGTPCLVSGWGKSNETGGGTVVVNHVVVPAVDWNSCKYAYGGGIVEGIITDDMMCAGYQEGGKDSCQGDSGGPLVTYNDQEGRWILVGVVSWGIGCARANIPGVYARVSYFVPWIEKTIAENSW